MHENCMEDHLGTIIYVHFSLNSISSSTIENSSGWQTGDEEISQVGGERVGA